MEESKFRKEDITNATANFNIMIFANSKYKEGNMSLSEIYKDIQYQFREFIDNGYTIESNIDIPKNKISFKLIKSDSISIPIITLDLKDKNIKVIDIGEKVGKYLYNIKSKLLEEYQSLQMRESNTFKLTETINECIDLIERDIVEYELDEEESKVYLNKVKDLFKTIFGDHFVTFTFNKGDDNKYRYVVDLRRHKTEIILIK